MNSSPGPGVPNAASGTSDRDESGRLRWPATDAVPTRRAGRVDADRVGEALHLDPLGPGAESGAIE